MKCERCEGVASVRLVLVVNDEKVERHLCERCAETQGDLAPTIHAPPDDDNKVAALAAASIEIRRAAAIDTSPRCPSCETTHNQFRRQGKLGCPDCYAAFRTQLDGLLDKIHGRTRHRGKRPDQPPTEAALGYRLTELQGRLARAVGSESYEEAAQLRDQIRALAPTTGTHGAP